MTDAALGSSNPPAVRSRRRPLSPRIVCGGLILMVVLVCALFAPWLAPHDPNDIDLMATLTPPMWEEGGSSAYPLGADSLGRCTLSRLIYGARVALTVAATGAGGALILGAVLAFLAGYLGGWPDWLISRAIELWMSIPPVVMALVLMVGLGAGLKSVILAIILVDWTRFCRVLRAEVMVTASQNYVKAARLLGVGHWRILVRELLPAALPTIITLLALEMGVAVVVEAVLSFVGMSVESDIPAWGQMIAANRTDMHQAPWGLAAPVLAIVATVIGFNMLGDGLRLRYDPRLFERR